VRGTMGKKIADLAQLLHTSDVFGELPEKALREIAASGRVEQMTESVLLAAPGETPTHLHYVVAGSINLTYTTLDGRVAALPIFRGHWATWLGCFAPSPVDYAMWTSRKATLVSFPAAIIRRHVEKDPEALLHVMRHISVTLRYLIRWTLQSAVLSPDKRLASFLLLATEMASAGAFKVDQIKISQEQFGQLGLGSRQRVGRLLRDLAGRNLIIMNYGEVHIPDRAVLAAYLDSPDEPEDSGPAWPGPTARAIRSHGQHDSLHG
jgi:CRP-like cAMP-binding protein